ncbi:hypothetical protein [Pseudonocardia sp. KRD291]|uniref:hypothetical protein n=1 Tax=Pseudonocardia sp. KRD291 TaxID=2792007 RepID=UPI001C4A5966|nr:hypothetical protein [Pseudonocardia sp. KRD291]MBW0104081.1 hypothetical protein [Pseudonocardia sp. KRD291]
MRDLATDPLDDVPAADAAEQDRPVDPDEFDGVDPSTPGARTSQSPTEADPADVMEQRLDAGDDEDYER